MFSQWICKQVQDMRHSNQKLKGIKERIILLNILWVIQEI